MCVCNCNCNFIKKMKISYPNENFFKEILSVGFFLGQ